MRRILMSVGGALLAVAGSSQKPVAKVDDSGLARLNEAQMEPVDSARVEEGRANDGLAKTRGREADARARLEVAKSERGVADAQLKRALAERDLLKKQYASNEKMAEIDQEVAASRDRVQASDLKSQYLQLMINVAEADRERARGSLGKRGRSRPAGGRSAGAGSGSPEGDRPAALERGGRVQPLAAIGRARPHPRPPVDHVGSASHGRTHIELTWWPLRWLRRRPCLRLKRSP